MRTRLPRRIILDPGLAAADGDGKLLPDRHPGLRQGKSLADKGGGGLFAPQDLVDDAPRFPYIGSLAEGGDKFPQGLHFIVALEIDDGRNGKILFKHHEDLPSARCLWFHHVNDRRGVIPDDRFFSNGHDLILEGYGLEAKQLPLTFGCHPEER